MQKSLMTMNVISLKNILSKEESSKKNLKELSKYKGFNIDLPTYMDLIKENKDIPVPEIRETGNNICFAPKGLLHIRHQDILFFRNK